MAPLCSLTLREGQLVTRRSEVPPDLARYLPPYWLAPGLAKRKRRPAPPRRGDRRPAGPGPPAAAAERRSGTGPPLAGSAGGRHSLAAGWSRRAARRAG